MSESSKVGRSMTLAALSLVWLFAVASPPAALAETSDGTSSVTAFTRWERAWYRLNVPFQNDLEKYRDLDLTVTITNEATGDTLDVVRGFWKVGYWYGFRYSFPPGTWRYRTTCPNVSVLDDITGIVVSTLDSSSANPLTLRGFGQVQGGQLLYRDGTPFYWKGDTAWAAGLLAPLADTVGNPNEWEDYLEARSADGFTVIQLGIAQSWMDIPIAEAPEQPVSAEIRKPFVQLANCIPAATLRPNNCDYPNHAFWSDFDTKVEMANNRGIVVLVASVAKPVHDPGDESIDDEDSVTFARYLAGRLAGNAVIFSPTLDDYLFSNADTQALNGEGQLAVLVGNALEAAAPDYALKTLHLSKQHGQDKSASEYEIPIVLNGEPWLDFHMIQSGRGGKYVPENDSSEYGSLKQLAYRAHEIPKRAHALTSKPIINGEAMYDKDCRPWGGKWSNRKVVRKTAYWSSLSGAYGYSYGSFGAWDWFLDPVDEDPDGCPDDITSQVDTVAEVVGLASADDMDFLRDRLTDLGNWWQLIQRDNLILSNPGASDPARWQSFAVLADGSKGLAYLPDRGEIHLNLAAAFGSGAKVRVQSFFPSDGTTAPGSGCFSNVGSNVSIDTTQPQNPDITQRVDALLILEKVTSCP